MTIREVGASVRTRAELDGIVDRTLLDLSADFRLQAGELLNAALITGVPTGLEHPGSELLMVIHHLAVDALSWSFLLDDLEELLRAGLEGREPSLQSPSTSYGEWAQRLEEYAQSAEAAHQLPLWTDIPGSLEGPGDHPGGSDLQEDLPFTAASRIGSVETEALLRELPRDAKLRPDDVLLCALVETFFRAGGTSELMVDLESHGREIIAPEIDLTRSVGWYTSMYPITLRRGEGMVPIALVRSVKDQLRRVPDSGVGYGALRYLSQDPEVRRQLRTRPQARILFNNLGSFERLVPRSELFGLGGPLSLVRPMSEPRAHAVEVNAHVQQGRLTIDWVIATGIRIPELGEERVDKGSAGKLVSLYAAVLEELVTVLIDAGDKALTPSDFPEARLSADQLSKVLQRFGEGG
jgi:non-ribosomal peptide synthase protein (TIGR01720 family)